MRSHFPQGDSCPGHGFGCQHGWVEARPAVPHCVQKGPLATSNSPAHLPYQVGAPEQEPGTREGAGPCTRKTQSPPQLTVRRQTPLMKMTCIHRSVKKVFKLMERCSPWSVIREKCVRSQEAPPPSRRVVERRCAVTQLVGMGAGAAAVGDVIGGSVPGPAQEEGKPGHTDTSASVLTAAKTWKEPQCPSTDRHEVRSIHTGRGARSSRGKEGSADTLQHV